MNVIMLLVDTKFYFWLQVGLHMVYFIYFLPIIFIKGTLIQAWKANLFHFYKRSTFFHLGYIIISRFFLKHTCNIQTFRLSFILNFYIFFLKTTMLIVLNFFIFIFCDWVFHLAKFFQLLWKRKHPSLLISNKSGIPT